MDEIVLDHASQFDADDGTMYFFWPDAFFFSDGVYRDVNGAGLHPSGPFHTLAGPSSVLGGLLHAHFEGAPDTQMWATGVGFVSRFDFDWVGFDVLGSLGAQSGVLVGTAKLLQDHQAPHATTPVGSTVAITANIKLLNGASFAANMFESNLAWEYTGRADLSAPAAPAFTEDCDGDSIMNAAEIALGIEADCQGNWVPDACEIAQGAPDCNLNGAPDECDADCDGSGTPDECDLADQPLLDCNQNEQPDVCDLRSLVETPFFDDFSTVELDALRWPNRTGPTTTTNIFSSPPGALLLNLGDEVETKPLDLSGTAEARIAYWWKYQFGVPLNLPVHLYVEYWDGKKWHALHAHHEYVYAWPWRRVVLLLPQRARHSEFRLRFRCESDVQSNSWYIDDLIIETTSHDGDVNGVIDTCE